MKFVVHRLFLLMLILLAGSCGSYKRMAYLQDLEIGRSYAVSEQPETKIGVGDRLSIVVTCKNPALAAPFNAANGLYTSQSSADETVGSAPVAEQEDKGYLVDKNGDIDFPVLGKINVAGTTLEEVKAQIEYLLKEKPYIQDPLVFVEFQNFRITVLGETGQGNYEFNSGSVTILELMAQIGGVSPTGVMKEVWVIRTTRGERKLYTINLKSKSLYDSPVYYLQQNDLVYVKPKKNLLDADMNNMLSLFTFALTLVSTVSTFLLLYKRL